MSLEDLIKEETGNNFKEKIVHYSKFTATSIYRGAIDVFRLPTANRLRKEAESQRTPKFLEEVIRDSVKGSLQLFIMGSFLLSPPLGLTALATNIGSYIYENFLVKNEPVQQTYSKQIENKEYFKAWNPLKKAYNNLKQFSIKNNLNKFPRNFAKFACTYTLIGSMALGHLFASSKLRTAPEYNPALLNVEVQKISLNREGKTHEFYLLGEVHLYNYSSEVYVKELIKQKKISMLLSEGVDLSQSIAGEEIEQISLRELIKEQNISEMSWRNICEGLVGATFAVIY